MISTSRRLNHVVFRKGVPTRLQEMDLNDPCKLTHQLPPEANSPKRDFRTRYFSINAPTVCPFQECLGSSYLSSLGAASPIKLLKKSSVYQLIW